MNSGPDCGNNAEKRYVSGAVLGLAACQTKWNWEIAQVSLSDQARYPIQDRSFVAHGRSWMPCAPAIWHVEVLHLYRCCTHTHTQPIHTHLAHTRKRSRDVFPSVLQYLPFGKFCWWFYLHWFWLKQLKSIENGLPSPGLVKLVADLHFDVEPLDPSDFPAHQVIRCTTSVFGGARSFRPLFSMPIVVSRIQWIPDPLPIGTGRLCTELNTTDEIYC